MQYLSKDRKQKNTVHISKTTSLTKLRLHVSDIKNIKEKETKKSMYLIGLNYGVRDSLSLGKIVSVLKQRSNTGMNIKLPKKATKKNTDDSFQLFSFCLLQIGSHSIAQGGLRCTGWSTVVCS